MLDPILFELSLLFGLSVGVALIVHRLRMPPIVGFLLAGVFAGPHGIGLIRHRELVDNLAEIGVVVLLFTVGMELAVGGIGRLRRAILIGGGLQVGLSISVGAIVAWSAGAAPPTAVFIGFVFALSSTAAISKLLGDRAEINTPAGRHAIGVCVAQDLAVVPMILLVPVLRGADQGVGDALLGTLKAGGLLSLAVLLAWFAVPRVLDLVARTRSRELFVLSVIAICLALAAVTAELGLSLALGAFLAGAILGRSDYHHQAISEVEPFRDTLASLFFLSIGMLFDGSVVLEEPLLVAVSFTLVIGGKACLAWLAMRALRLPRIIATRSSLMVAQIGEFGFVLIQLAGGDLFPPRLERIFFVVAVLSIALTPLWFGLGAMLAKRDRGGKREPSTPIGGEIRDHVIVVGFGPVGRTLADALGDAEIPYRVVEMNAATVKAERARGRPIVLGDASRPSMLHALAIERARMVVVAINDPARVPRVVSLARRMAPHVHIIARANYTSEVPQLLELEVDEVVPQELETSVEIVIRSLRFLLASEEVVERQVERIRGQAVAGVARSERRVGAADVDGVEP